MPTIDIIKILENTGVLKKQGPQVFANHENFPWISVTCVNSKNGNFAHNDWDQSDMSNQISVVASKQDPSNENKYVELLRRIANNLNWELVLEEDDNGNEDVVLS